MARGGGYRRVESSAAALDARSQPVRRGPVKEAYKFAEKNPALLAQLHCYCGCDKAEGHQNLLDCYRSMHGSSCEICTGEALLAKRMSEQGSPVDQIRNAIRRNFAQDN